MTPLVPHLWIVTVHSTDNMQYRYTCASLHEAIALVETVRKHWTDAAVTLVKAGHPYRKAVPSARALSRDALAPTRDHVPLAPPAGTDCPQAGIRWQADPHRRRVRAEERKRCGSLRLHIPAPRTGQE